MSNKVVMNTCSEPESWTGMCWVVRSRSSRGLDESYRSMWADIVAGLSKVTEELRGLILVMIKTKKESHLTIKNYNYSANHSIPMRFEVEGLSWCLRSVVCELSMYSLHII